MSDAVLSRPRTRYVVRWRKVPELIALTASVAVWLAFLLRGG